MSIVIQLKSIHKTYQTGNIKVQALKGVDLTIKQGEFVAIMGASGSGKSTLMNLLGCLDKATSGDYLLDGENISDLDKNRYAEIRNKKIGFVFQGFNLLSRTTALENVQVPLFYSRERWSREKIRQKGVEVLSKLGLESRLHHIPNELSGGQQQRVAIARALINDPQILLADEPTGNLDTKTSIDIMSLFTELNQKGITIILVTHEPDIAECAERRLVMKDGLIIKDVHKAKERV